jgi:hypothetical protein
MGQRTLPESPKQVASKYRAPNSSSSAVERKLLIKILHSIFNISKPVSTTRHVRYRRLAFAFAGVCVFLFLIWKAATTLDWNPRYRVGQEIDRLNGVAVFYNGGVGHSTGRNLAPDGYNLGIKYQCVEFVKR